MSELKEKEIIKVTCVGLRIGTKDNKLIGIVRVSDSSNIVGDIAYYDFKGMGDFYIGGVYEIKASLKDDEIEYIIPKSASYVGKFNNKSLIEEWQIEHESTKTMFTVKAQVKKASTTGKDTLLEALKPLRRAYASTNYEGRLALEVRVLNYLRNGRDL